MSDSRKLRVLHVGKFYPPYMGGIETHLQNLCNELKDLVDLKVLVSNSNTQTIEETVEGVSVTRVGTRATLSAAPISPGLVSRIRREAADIVHLHHPNPVAVMAYLLSGHRGTLVITYHSDIVRQKKLGAIFQPFLERALAWSDAIIATSPNYLETSTVLQAHRERCEVLPYGIPVEQFTHRDEPAIARLRERFGSRVVITVGRLIYYKGFDVLVRAMKDVDGTLLVIGDGPLRAELEALSQSLGIGDRVHFLGEIHNRDVAAYYHASDVFALASVARSEAFGIVQLEAMACGLPVVNTSLDSGVPFVSLDGLTGLTVPPGDSDALSRALTTLLDDSDLRARMGEAARRRVDTEFTSPVMGRRMLDLYTSLVRRREAGRATSR